MNYRADIDGLRAFAVLSVILFHSGFSTLSGGFVGVDIFFVISGYVIAKSILKDLNDNNFTILQFYAKRVRRIFPALVFTLCVTIVGAYFILLPDYFSSFSESLSAVALFISNLFFWKDSGYFSNDALSKPLLHTWSLSVEEQYYILSPIYTYLVYRFFSKRFFLAFVPVLLGSLMLSIYVTDRAPTANFFLPITRAWELLIGAMLAQTPLPSITKKWISELLGVIGFGFIIYPALLYTEATPFPGKNAIMPCIGTALLIYSGTYHTTFSAKILSLKPFNIIGKASYSLYLVHWPVIVAFYYLTLTRPDYTQSAYILSLTFLLGFFSWHFIERPFRHLDVKIYQKKLLLGALACILVFLALGQLGMIFKGFPDRYPDYAQIKIPGNEQWNRGTCFFDKKSAANPWNQEICTIVDHKNSKKVLFWGDSFAAQHVPGIIANKDKFNYSIVQYTSAGCPPILSYYSFARPDCTSFNARAIDIIRDRKFDAVILVAKWTDLKGRGYEELNTTLNKLKEIGIPFLIIGQTPEFSIDVQILHHHQKKHADGHLGEWTVFFDININKELEQIVGEKYFINPMENLCKGNLCPYYQDEFLYEDYGHFSVKGSDIAVKKYFPMSLDAFPAFKIEK